MKHLNKYAITLALLLGAATGTWAQDDITVTKSGVQANQWQYTMPEVNVELTVNYFPTATFSEGGEPTAIEGVVAGTDNPIVSAGESTQGTVKYFVTADVNAPAPDYDATGWTSTVPTAVIVQGDRTESTKAYVYYYIKGNDAPEGQAATAENTFNDTDILGPLTVTLKKNVFTVALRPLTQFTTDGGQATVTVDGQLTSLKQGKTITIAAAEGYKIRSAKMGGAAVPVGEVISSDLGMLLGKDGNLYANIAAAEAAGTTAVAKLGMLLGEDGYLYANKAAAEAAGTRAVAKIVYVGSNTGVEGYDRGLALHLADEDWADIPGAYWCQPSKAQWETMFEAAGTPQVEGYRALSDGLRESGGDDLYTGDVYAMGLYYSTDFPQCFDFNAGEWVNWPMGADKRNIHAIAPAAELSGDKANLNDARTEAIYTVPYHDAIVKYLLARDLTQQVAFAGIPAEPVGLTMGPDGNYQPATPLDIQINDAIAGANIISAKGLTVSYEKQDGDTWTVADDFLTNMQPGTYRIVAAATDEMSPYDGTLTSATFTLADNIRLDEAADNSPVLATKDGQQANVTLTRTLQTGGYNTFSVPFAIPADKYSDYKLTGVKKLSTSAFDSETGELTLTFAAETKGIEAGKPYLVKVSETVQNPVFNGVTISSTATTTETTAVDFIPTLGETTIAGDVKSILFLGASNKLYHPSAENQQMKGFRAYFQLKGNAKAARAFRLDFGDGEVQGIREMEDGKWKMENGSYDLQGRRVESSIFNSQSSILKKGVYIVNGKKRVVK